MRKRTDYPAGTVHRLDVDCVAVAGNLLGDPTRRRVDVYVPAGLDGAGLPLIVYLAAYTSSGAAAANWHGFHENLPERIDRLVATGELPPCVVAMPDGFTRLGGNQYIDSPVLGGWSTALNIDILPAVETRFGCGGSGRRALVGTSSGGYGAVVNAMLAPDIWAACASHAGDMAFEHCYLPDMPALLRTLARHDGSIEQFIAAFEAADRPNGADIQSLMILAMAASYDPDPTAPFGIRLPVTMDTCEPIADRWANWLAWDPVRLAERHGAALGRLKAVHIDCGDVDPYNLLYGARRLHRVLTAQAVPHRYEEFAGNHSGLDRRLDVSLPFMAAALSDGTGG